MIIMLIHFCTNKKESIRLGEGLTSSDGWAKPVWSGPWNASRSIAIWSTSWKSRPAWPWRRLPFVSLRTVIAHSQNPCWNGHTDPRHPWRRKAALGYLGVINTIDMADFLQFDLGGASVEITLVRDRPGSCTAFPFPSVRSHWQKNMIFRTHLHWSR